MRTERERERKEYISGKVDAGMNEKEGDANKERELQKKQKGGRGLEKRKGNKEASERADRQSLVAMWVTALRLVPEPASLSGALQRVQVSEWMSAGRCSR